MRYRVLDGLREISESRGTIRLGELINRLNQEKDDDTVLKVSRVFNGRYALEILDNHTDRYGGTKVSVVITSSDGNAPVNANTQFYVVCVFCRNNDVRYGFNHWDLADNNGVTYSQLEKEYRQN
jgi:hypothetical protein